MRPSRKQTFTCDLFTSTCLLYEKLARETNSSVDYQLPFGYTLSHHYFTLHQNGGVYGRHHDRVAHRLSWSRRCRTFESDIPKFAFTSPGVMLCSSSSPALLPLSRFLFTLPTLSFTYPYLLVVSKLPAPGADYTITEWLTFRTFFAYSNYLTILITQSYALSLLSIPCSLIFSIIAQSSTYFLPNIVNYAASEESQ